MEQPFVFNLCVALFIVALVAFVCNIVATSPTFVRNSRAIRDSSTWDNNRVKYTNSNNNEGN